MSLKAAIFPLLACLATSPASALDETLDISSRAIPDEDFLRGDGSGAPPVTITGHLTGPDNEAPVPVVILLHGTDGPRSGAAGSWRAFLNRNGMTTLRLDSYTGRGLAQASAEQDSFGQFAQIYDAYRAADALADDSRVDASRIVVIGFSRGGGAALYSAMTRFQDAFGPRRATIVAHLPFYPACNFELKDELEVTGAPIRLFHGAQDDWTLASTCRAYIERLKEAGADAEMIEYPDARHAFDNPGNPSLYQDRRNQTSRDCLRQEEDSRLLNAETGETFTYRDACVAYGPTAQYDYAAATAAQAAVAAFLTELFAAKPER